MYSNMPGMHNASSMYASPTMMPAAQSPNQSIYFKLDVSPQALMQQQMASQQNANSMFAMPTSLGMNSNSQGVFIQNPNPMPLSGGLFNNNVVSVAKTNEPASIKTITPQEYYAMMNNINNMQALTPAHHPYYNNSPEVMLLQEILHILRRSPMLSQNPMTHLPIVYMPIPKEPEKHIPIPVKEGAKIWGDPHFVGADGEIYDIHGTANMNYNILSDKDLQVNAKFSAHQNERYIQDLGVTLGKDKIKVTADKKLFINDVEIKEGAEHLNKTVTRDKDIITIKSPEYTITVKPQGGHIDVDFASKDVFSDKVLPHGLWGVTADGLYANAKGAVGKTAQGGGVIKDATGKVTDINDIETVKLYQVSDIFDTNFTTFNRFKG